MISIFYIVTVCASIGAPAYNTIKLTILWLVFLNTYTARQKHESTLLHTYVLNEFLTADRSWKTEYFWKNSYKSLLLTSLHFFWHRLHQNWSIFRGTESLWSMFGNRQIAAIKGKCRQFRNLKSHCDSNNLPILTQKVPKEV